MVGADALCGDENEKREKKKERINAYLCTQENLLQKYCGTAVPKKNGAMMQYQGVVKIVMSPKDMSAVWRDTDSEHLQTRVRE